MQMPRTVTIEGELKAAGRRPARFVRPEFRRALPAPESIERRKIAV
jgi:hypothetical protein